jgi:SAM-dependent methyltransferase
LKPALRELIRCNRCGAGNLQLADARCEGDEVLTGSLTCTCGNKYPIIDGILRTVDSDQYVGSFSFEWKLHRKTQLDAETNGKSTRVFCRKTGLDLKQLAGKRVLDVGVGTGRFADVIQRSGAQVVGIDLSRAVETAMENVGRRANANIVQADLFKLPFARESFDLIYSMGVLHHTPDCKKAFLGLVPYLRPGGTIVIWVYNGHVWEQGSVIETVNRFWRSITSRMPNRLLYALCVLEVPWYFVRRIPGMEQFLHLALPGLIYHAIPPTNKHRNISEHVLDTFDWYSPRYQSKHTYPEVFGWFEEAGLSGIRVLSEPVAVSGIRTQSNGASAEKNA